MTSYFKQSKKISVCILSLIIVMILFLFTSCKSKENPQVYDVERDGKIYTVDLENQTIAVDDYICSFELSDSTYGGNFTVTYPDGSTYWWGQSCGGWSDDFDPQKYVEGDVLWEVLTSDDQNQGSHSGQYFLIAFSKKRVSFNKIPWREINTRYINYQVFYRSDKHAYIT